jgi:hypothetical protein
MKMLFAAVHESGSVARRVSCDPRVVTAGIGGTSAVAASLGSPPCQLLVLAGPEHGRTIPLTEDALTCGGPS